MRLALISKSRVAGLFVPLGPPPGLILTVGHVGCNRRCANLEVNAFLVPPQLYTVGGLIKRSACIPNRQAGT